MRDFFAVVILGACVLTSTFRHLSDTYALDWFRDMSGQLTALARTAHLVQKQFGGETTEVGYVSDEDESQSIFYYGLQYQLFPAVLSLSTAPKFVICHLHNSAKLDPILKQHLRIITADKDQGFYLLTHS